ncbi:MAG TPA: AzlC family ABC transporter permease [Acidimicrobiales bacterium]|jgi:predicted branched-subunit amino acid permease
MHSDTRSTPTSSTSTRLADFIGGARSTVPWLFGIAPFGLVIGVSAARADIPLFAGWLTGPLIFAGSAQVATIELLDTHTAAVVVVIAALAINLRLVLYSASMARYWHEMPRWWQAFAAFLLIDPSLAVGADGYDTISDRRRAHRHYLGGAITLFVVWVLAITIGATAGSRLPSGLQLEMVIPLFLTGEVVHRLRDKPTTCAAVAAAVVAVLATPVPLHLGPIVAIAAGVAVGLYMDRRDQ